MNKESENKEQPQEDASKPLENAFAGSEARAPESQILNEAINPTTQTEQQMEVHHHAHHGHEKKTFKSYFWEFFMLFLAVFCGSIAELQLEHYIENKREIKYIKSMIQDLKTDTTNLTAVISAYEILVKSQDSIFYSFDAIDHGGNKTFMRHLSYFDVGFPDFINADATIQQLKNAGGFRLIQSKSTVDSIIAYNASLTKTFINTNLLVNMLVDLNNFKSSFINYQTVVKATVKRFDYDKLQEQHLSLFISKEKAEKQKLYGKLLYYNILMKSISEGNFNTLKRQATRLITYLQKEYHLEHE